MFDALVEKRPDVAPEFIDELTRVGNTYNMVEAANVRGKWQYRTQQLRNALDQWRTKLNTLFKLRELNANAINQYRGFWFNTLDKFIDTMIFTKDKSVKKQITKKVLDEITRYMQELAKNGAVESAKKANQELLDALQNITSNATGEIDPDSIMDLVKGIFGEKVRKIKQKAKQGAVNPKNPVDDNKKPQKPKRGFKKRGVIIEGFEDNMIDLPT
jgi:hypothetical protein